MSGLGVGKITFTFSQPCISPLHCCEKSLYRITSPPCTASGWCDFRVGRELFHPFPPGSSPRTLRVAAPRPCSHPDAHTEPTGAEVRPETLLEPPPYTRTDRRTHRHTDTARNERSLQPAALAQTRGTATEALGDTRDNGSARGPGAGSQRGDRGGDGPRPLPALPADPRPDPAGSRRRRGSLRPPGGAPGPGTARPPPPRAGPPWPPAASPRRL